MTDSKIDTGRDKNGNDYEISLIEEDCMRRALVLILVLGVLALPACSGSVLEMDVGTCFNDPDSSGPVAEVPTIDCDEPHDNEVIANRDLEGDEFPGLDRVKKRATAVCLDSFAGYVGLPYDKSIYEIGAFYPTEDTWSSGDREVICYAFDMNLAKITGSINGVGK